MKPRKLTAALAALMLCLSLRAVIVVPPQVAVNIPQVFTVQTFWINGITNDASAVLAVLPTTAPDYLAATSASAQQVITSTNLVYLGTNSNWYVNTNGIYELDFTVTNPPNGLITFWPVGNGVLYSLPPATNWNFYNVLSAPNGVLVK